MPRIDLHVHLAGVAGDDSGCFVSPRMKGTITYRALLKLVGVDPRDPRRANETYAERLSELLNTSQELDYACIFAMDGVYDAQGELVPTDSHLYVPNSYVFEVCRPNPKLLPVISVNPQRRDALEELERWGDLAIALKWLAPLQKFDPSLPRYADFYATLKRLDLPVIAHTGCEHTFPGMHQDLGNPALYEALLKTGVPVVFSHCGTGSIRFPAHDYSDSFANMLDRYDNAFGDTSAFCNFMRFKQIRRFSSDRYVGRVLHGSDFPVPSNAVYFLGQLGFGGVLKLEGLQNPLDRDVRIKRQMGMPEASFTYAYELLEKRITRWLAAR